MRIRDAAVTDLDDVVRLTRAARQELAKWSPVYFRKREGSDEAHAGFLQFLLGSADHRTNVIEDEGRAIGFFQVVPQPSHWWVDDLCLEHERWWPSVCAALSTELPDRPWVTCVSELDTERARALSGTGLRITSSYWSAQLVVVSSSKDRKLDEILGIRRFTKHVNLFVLSA